MEILKSNLFLFLCLFVVCSCNDKVSERPFVIDNENTKHIEQSEFDEMFKSISVIPLETTEECVVVNIKKIYEISGNIYILSESSSGQTALYRFDNKGRFLNRIGSMGNARNEYKKINTFFVHEDEVYIIDANKRNLIRYSSDGTCIDIIELGETLQFVNDAQLLGDGKTLLLAYGINFNESHPLYKLINLETGDIIWELNTRYKASGNFPHSMYAMATYGQSPLLTLPIDKTIYTWDTEKHVLDAMFDINCYGKLNAPSTDEYMDAEREQERGTLICGIFCADNVLVINFVTGCVVWNIVEERGVRLDYGVDYKTCKTIPCIPLSIVSASDHYFVTSWDPDNLKNCLKDIGHTNLIDAGILTSISEKSNPILVKHYLK